MNKPRAFAIAAAIGIIAVIGGYVALLAAKTLEPHHVAIGNRPVWTEVRWPFPLDQFGRGRAFHCRAADCGTPLTLYVRAKIGFCNCTTGVADDAELERISDLELLGGKFSALRDGHPISVAFRASAAEITGSTHWLHWRRQSDTNRSLF